MGRYTMGALIKRHLVSLLLDKVDFKTWSSVRRICHNNEEVILTGKCYLPESVCASSKVDSKYIKQKSTAKGEINNPQS